MTWYQSISHILFNRSISGIQDIHVSYYCGSVSYHLRPALINLIAPKHEIKANTRLYVMRVRSL